MLSDLLRQDRSELDRLLRRVQELPKPTDPATTYRVVFPTGSAVFPRDGEEPGEPIAAPPPPEAMGLCGNNKADAPLLECFADVLEASTNENREPAQPGEPMEE